MLDGKTAYRTTCRLPQQIQAARQVWASISPIRSCSPVIRPSAPGLCIGQGEQPADEDGERRPITNVGVLYVAKRSRCTVSDITLAGS